MYAVTRYHFLVFQYLKNYTFNKNDKYGFLSYALFIYKTLAADDDACLGWGWSKIRFFVQNS